MRTCILDLNNDQEKKYIRIGSDEIIVSRVPAMTTIMYDQIARESLDMKSNEDAAEIFEKSITAILITLNANLGKEQPEYTREWLLSKCGYSDFSKILAALHGNIKKKKTKEQVKQ